LRRLFFVAIVACGSQQPSAQTQTQTAPTQSVATAPTQSVATAPTQSIAPMLAPTACKTNDECAMSITRACCSPCSVPPFADFKSEVDTLKRRCSEVECTQRVPQECKPTESIDAYHAECQNAACVAVRNPSPRQPPVAPAQLASSASCSKDADCMVTNFGGCCASCSDTAHAMSTRDYQTQMHRCAILDCTAGEREVCPPIVSAELYRAVCRAGTCAGIKR
jgi:hypothetical protein